MLLQYYMSPTQTSVLRALSYFDIFECPLTCSEILSFVDQPANYLEVAEELKRLVADKIIQTKDGFYSLRLENIVSRQSRYSVSRRKLKKSIFISKIFARLPWVKFTGLANQIGAHNLRDGGDLDFFIIVEPGKLWLTRFLIGSLMTITHQRPTAKKNQDQICLSFFISADNLNLQPYLLADQKDIYFTYWLASLRPLYDAGNYYEQLVAKNGWLKNNLPNWSEQSSLLVVEKIKVWTWLNILQLLEKFFKNWQLKHLPAELKNASNSNVVINDNVLKLHANDKRREFCERYEERLNNISVKE